MSKAAYEPNENEIQTMCRLIYNQPGGANWDKMKHISPLLNELTRASAVRVLKYFHEHKDAWDLI